MPKMIVHIPFEVDLKHYPPGTTLDKAIEEERQALEDGRYSVDEFIDPNSPITVTVEP